MANPNFSINPDSPDPVAPVNAPRPLRPTGVPQSKKEFKKVMGKDQSEEDDDEEKNVKDAKGDVKGAVPKNTKQGEVPVEDKASIFTLSGGPKKQVAMKKEVAQETDNPEQDVEELISKGQKQVTNFHPLLKGQVQTPKAEVNLYTIGEKKEPDMSVQSKGKKAPTPSVDQPVVAFVDEDEEQTDSFMDNSKEDAEKVAINTELMVQKPLTQTIVPGAKEIKAAAPVRQAPEPIFTPKVKEHTPTTKFSQEQPDLAYVNPMRMGVQATSTNTGPNVQLARPSLSPDMLKLIDHMVEQITTLTNEGKTDTSIILKNPPMFDGANLKLTSFDSARGEFNISFENLKPEALRLLQGNMDSLKMAMNDKGFTVHIMTATTIAETPIYTAESGAGGERRDRDEEGQGQQRQQKEEEER